MRFPLFALLMSMAVSVHASDLVILMSWDGFRHDFPDRGNYPALKKMEMEGVRTSLIPTTPSNTFPGHVTLATGAAPTVHGVLDNTMYDRNKGAYAYSDDPSWINAEPLWIAAERQGAKAATYFWVGSESDWRGQGQTYRMAPFDSDRDESVKVDRMIEWIDLPAEQRPSLIMAYWRGADHTAHMNGPDHADVASIIAVQDKELQRLMDAIESRGLWDSTTMIVTSDHGMTQIKKRISISDPLDAAGIEARVVGGSTVKRVFMNDVTELESAVEVLERIDDIEVFAAADVPEPFRFPDRTGDIVVTTEMPNALGRGDSLLETVWRFLMPIFDWGEGGHGYDANHPDMAATFLAVGAGVEQGKQIAPIQQDQVAATVMALLGLAPPMDATGEAVVLD